MRMPPGGERGRSTRLDAIRGTAVLAVIGVHAFQSTWYRVDGAGLSQDGLLYQAGSLLRYGVELFFALSGWLIFSLYFQRDHRGYWPRRLARIWPLWALFAVATVVAMWVAGWTFIVGQFDSSLSISPILALALALAFLGWTNAVAWNIPPGGWSIQVEMGHYLGFWAWRRRGPWFWLATIPVGYATYALARWLTLHAEHPGLQATGHAWIRLGVYGTWPFFVAGGLAYLYWHRRSTLLAQLGLERPLGRVGLATLVVAILTWSWFIPVPFGKSPEAAAMVVVLTLVTVLVIRSRLASRALVSMGQVSYFAYFAHFWFVTALSALLVESLRRSGQVISPATMLGLVVLTFIGSVFASWALGKASWRWIESPIIRRVRVATDAPAAQPR